jgi:D-threonate/D-erythronate kinase
MIAAIADDVTGAAEIAGIGRRYGLKAQVSTSFDAGADADLVVIDTDTRSATPDVARRVVEEIARRLQSAQVSCCYKKVDSVLRGNVAVELETLSHALHKSRTILAPANPSKGRVIADGRYLIDHVPLDRTEFGDDPEHPVRSCLVVDLLNASGHCPVRVLKRRSYAGTEAGVIIVAEAQTSADLAQWAECVDEGTLAAGGSEFFMAILERRILVKAISPRETLVPLVGPRWFVCGSGSESSRRAVAAARSLGVPVCPMPEGLFRNPSCDESLTTQWACNTVSALATHGCAVAAIDQPVRTDTRLALGLRTCMAGLVQQVVGQMRIRELFIEGGATARAVLDRMRWDTLNVLGEYGLGVVRSSVRTELGQIITLKPGSYPWPDALWRQCFPRT